ncbi:MAG TPA: VWA domain-containing protein [Candidatus Binataceae bacterium]|jgi:hypothetical protein|nr:VWA domain-containing protein [Candidatus Binataceae bacterium]
MIALREALLDLIGELREAGVRVSVAESIDAMRAVGAAGLMRSRMREALATALIKDEADRAIFDEIFGRRFGRSTASAGAHQSRGEFAGVAGSSGSASDTSLPVAARERRADDEAPPGASSSAPAKRESQAQQRAAEDSAARESAGGEGEREGSASVGGNDRAPAADADDAAGAGRDVEGAEEPLPPSLEAGRAARLRRIERLPFANYSEVELEAARDALGELQRRFRVRVSRRLRIARAGRIDFRRTIRASLQHGGVLAELRFRARRPRHIDLLILADISGSVKYASTLMLEITAGARDCFRRVRSFVYIDRLAEADFERGHLAMTPPLDLYARSDFGRVLAELWERRAALVTRATVIVIMGDGRNNRRPARADILRNLAGLSRAVLWLIAEPEARWNTGDSAIRQYAREVTALIACGNLRDLEHGLASIN